jgi:hypothetical protein
MHDTNFHRPAVYVKSDFAAYAPIYIEQFLSCWSSSPASDRGAHLKTAIKLESQNAPQMLHAQNLEQSILTLSMRIDEVAFK